MARISTAFVIAALLAAPPALAVGFQDSAHQGSSGLDDELRRAERNQFNAYFDCEISRPTKGELSADRLPAETGSLEVDGVDVQTVERGDRTLLRVTGQVRNKRDRKTPNPELAFTAYDANGRALVRKFSSAPGRIEAGQSATFAFEMPRPERAETVKVAIYDHNTERRLNAYPFCYRPELPIPLAR